MSICVRECWSAADGEVFLAMWNGFCCRCLNLC